MDKAEGLAERLAHFRAPPKNIRRIDMLDTREIRLRLHNRIKIPAIGHIHGQLTQAFNLRRNPA